MSMVVWARDTWWQDTLDEPVDTVAAIIAPTGSLTSWAEQAAAAAAAETGQSAIVEVAGLVERMTIDNLHQPVSDVTWVPLPFVGTLTHLDYAVAVAIGWSQPGHRPHSVIHPVTLPTMAPAQTVAIHLAEVLAQRGARELALQWMNEL